MVDALDLGANDYVTKPIDFPVVLARIRTQVTARRADPLTGLPNRVLFMDRLERLMARAQRAAGISPGMPSGASFAVLFLDIDRFKIINDSLGHLAGDELLISLARRLEQALRSTDTLSRFDGEPTLARLGGDEFTILLDGVHTASDAKAVADRLLSAVAHPFNLHGREIFTSVSIGIVMSAARYEHADDMVRDADTAMYRAKAMGKARAEVFDTSMLEAAELRLQLESDLRRAVRETVPATGPGAGCRQNSGRKRPAGVAAETGNHRKRHPGKLGHRRRDPEHAARVGVQLGLDDFGMGYSALSYLQRFPFQTLKIDRSFVSAMEQNGNAEIIRAIVSLASGLAMNVTAEGVETEEQAARLKDLACEFGQGFYFNRPLTPDDARALLQTRTWTIPPRKLVS